MPTIDAIDLEPALAARREALRARLAELGSVLVAFSGGVDSTLLLREAADVLGAEAVVAVTAAGPLTSRGEEEAAAALAEELGVRSLTIEWNPLEDVSDFSANPPERCYLCKRGLLTRFSAEARRLGLAHLAEGSNADDAGRPGRRAVEEAGAASPLLEAGLSKADVRALSRALGLATWDRPASPCLATRFPYGVTLQPEDLRRVGECEAFLHRRGLREVRVRCHGDLARIEAPLPAWEQLMEEREALLRFFAEKGFRHVALDLGGLRSGCFD